MSNRCCSPRSRPKRWVEKLLALALLEPVYILVGLSRMLTGLLSLWMWRWLKPEIAHNTRRIRQAMQQYRSPEVLQAQDVFSEFWNLYAAVMGFVSFILPLNLEWLMKLLLRPYQQQVEKLLRKDLQAQQLMWKWLKQINAVIEGIRHVARLLGVILIPLLILLVVTFYILWLYPHIPQNWGGQRASGRVADGGRQDPADVTQQDRCHRRSQARKQSPGGGQIALQHR